MHSRDAIQRHQVGEAWEAAGPERGAMAQRELDVFDALEAEYPQGISASQIVEFFAPAGVKPHRPRSQVRQLGLLPAAGAWGEGQAPRLEGPLPGERGAPDPRDQVADGRGMTLRHPALVHLLRGQLDGVERSWTSSSPP